MERKEIFKLRAMLEDAKIPFEFKQLSGTMGYLIRLNKYIDVTQSPYNENKELLEIMGATTKQEFIYNGLMKGSLTAEEVFTRFKYCYENNTVFYKEKEYEKSN